MNDLQWMRKLQIYILIEGFTFFLASESSINVYKIGGLTFLLLSFVINFALVHINNKISLQLVNRSEFTSLTSTRGYRGQLLVRPHPRKVGLLKKIWAWQRAHLPSSKTTFLWLSCCQKALNAFSCTVNFRRYHDSSQLLDTIRVRKQKRIHIEVLW